MKLVFATLNPGKLAELRALAPAGVEVAALSSSQVEEDGLTFQANAQKKAIAAARASGVPALADDSGLCVDALGGAPGVLSARYAPGDDAARVAKLLRALEGVADPERGARFECALALALPSGETWTVTGACAGRIARASLGSHGFGYDPVFVLSDGRTMAQLDRQEKSHVSHRAAAFARLRPLLERLARGERPMGSPEETKRAVEGYFNAWTANKPKEALVWLAPQLKFVGPTASYASAEAFYPALAGFAQMTRSARMTHWVLEGDRAAMLYDCELPPPVGTLRIASFFRVEGGKIVEYETQFDATELRKLLAKPISSGV